MNWNEKKDHITGEYVSPENTGLHPDSLILVSREKKINAEKIAAFDLDFTLIKPETGKFSKTSTDWCFYDDSVVEKVRKYYEEGYRIVIVSNQKGISTGVQNSTEWKQKIELLALALKVPFFLIASTKNDKFRKPRTCLWDRYITSTGSDSFYCGDAGMMPKRVIDGRKIPKDFSSSDMKFALNLGINFIHRDEFIYGDLALESLKNQAKPAYLVDFQSIPRGTYLFKPESFEVIVNVGYPGSGKSYYTKKHILPHGYVYLNQDTLKTAKRCRNACERALKENKSVIIDNTNPSIETRGYYIELAKKYGATVRAFHFKAGYDQSRHNNIYRHVNGHLMGKEERLIVPSIVYNIYRKKFVQPSKNEGFDKVSSFPFQIEPGSLDDVYFTYLE